MNSVNLVGRITRDIELKKTGSGKSFCGFSIAVDRNKDEADFIPCKAWDSTAENIAKFFRRGDRIGITGVLSTRTYEDNGQKHFIMEVLVRSFDFTESKPKAENTDTQTRSQPTQAEQVRDIGEVISNDGLPFEI